MNTQIYRLKLLTLYTYTPLCIFIITYQHSAKIIQLKFTQASVSGSIHYKLDDQVSVVNSFINYS